MPSKDDFNKYRDEVNLERERDIVKNHEGVMTMKLAEMAKAVNTLESENDKLRDQSMIRQISEQNF